MKKYTIERAFFDNNNNVVHVFDYMLEPMEHHEATVMLKKMYNKDVYKNYNCLDRLKEVK